MTKKEPKLIPYGKTLYNVLINKIKGKYFQHIGAPPLIAQIPQRKYLNIHYVEHGKLSVWFFLLERRGYISLEEFNQYAIISKEQFEDYKENKTNLSNIVLVHKDSPIFKEENNKPNLSANPQPYESTKINKISLKHFSQRRFDSIN